MMLKDDSYQPTRTVLEEPRACAVIGISADAASAHSKSAAILMILLTAIRLVLMSVFSRLKLSVSRSEVG